MRRRGASEAAGRGHGAAPTHPGAAVPRRTGSLSVATGRAFGRRAARPRGRALTAGYFGERRARADEQQMVRVGYSGMVLLPGAVAPVGKSSEGLPVGVQVVRAHGGDLSC